MNKSIKLRDNVYLDTKGIVHNRKVLADIIYPVGSIYISVNNTNPSTYYGGTWEQIKDRFLLACGNTYSNGATGGSDKHSHNLSNNGWANIVMHGSGYICYNERATPAWTQNFSILGTYENSGHGGESYGATLGGRTEETTILPPYLAVYVWKRTA